MAFRFPAAFALAYGCELVLVPLAITFGAMGSFSKEPLVERLRGTENWQGIADPAIIKQGDKLLISL